MKKPLYTLVFVLALSLAYASAQTSPSSPSTDQTTPQSQTAPQTSPSSSAPTTDQTAPASQSSSPSSQGSMPRSSASAGGDVQTQIQNALKSDPTLASDNITVSVTDAEVELNGSVMSAKEKQTAKRIAKSYAGSRKIKDSLTVSHNQGAGSGSSINPAGNAGDST